MEFVVTAIGDLRADDPFDRAIETTSPRDRAILIRECTRRTVLISELSEKTGVSKDTIRFYEKAGLLQTDIMARGENNYRQYTDEAIRKLNFIKRGKALGFTLKEIKKVIAEWDSISPE